MTGPNLASCDVLQEESAYLAGVLAALSTRSGVFGHISGIRVRPGWKGHAGYAAGVRDTDPQVKLLSNFSGNQDDNALSRRVTDVCPERDVRQIGNVID